MERRIFDGVRVLSLAEQLPGPYATLLLADLGADVILIERPDGGDPARVFPDFFNAAARNKRSVTLNLKVEADRSRFLSLVKTADVVIEGYTPGTAKRLGIDYEALSECNPRIIYASISGFGQTGPASQRRGHDVSFQASAGMLAANAKEPGPAPQIPVADMTAATFAAFAISSALFARERTGQGTSIDISMADCLVSWMTPFLGPRMNGGPAIDVIGSPGYGLFKCRDGRVLSLSVAHEDHFWKALCSVVGEPSMAGLDHHARMGDADRLREQLAKRLLEADLATWSTKLDDAKLPWGPVNSLDDVVVDSHFSARGLFGSITDGSSTQRFVQQPVKFSSFATSVRLPSPKLGEHNSEF